MQSLCSVEQGLRLHGKINSCYYLGLYLRTQVNCVRTSQSRWESESPERKGVEREEKKEFSLHRELSSPLLSVDTDCNFQQF
jgi:hypothetical protein